MTIQELEQELTKLTTQAMFYCTAEGGESTAKKEWDRYEEVRNGLVKEFIRLNEEIERLKNKLTGTADQICGDTLDRALEAEEKVEQNKNALVRMADHFHRLSQPMPARSVQTIEEAYAHAEEHVRAALKEE